MKIITYFFALCIALSMLNAHAAPTRACATTVCPNSFVCPTTVVVNGNNNPNAVTNCANFCCVNVTNSQTVNGTLSVTCEQISGNLTVGGSVNIEGSLIEEGNADFRASVCIGQDLTVGQNVTIGGNQTVDGGLNVNNGAFINGALVVNGDETVNGNINISQNEILNGNLLVDGAGTINGLLSANGGLVVTNGEVINGGGLVVACGGASITGDVTIEGNQSVDDLDVLGNVIVDENAFFNGCSTTVNGALTANGPVTMNRGLTIASGSETITSGDLTLNSGNLTVGGQSVFNGPVTANSSATIRNGLTVFGGQTISTGNLTIANCGNLTIDGGNLSVGEFITSTSRASLFQLLLTDTTNSTSPQTGTLIVGGGAAIGLDLWIGGSEFFQQVVREGGTPSPFNYYEETCFPVSFSFAGQTTVVQVQAVRVGNLVNLIVPVLTWPLGGVSRVVSVTQIPARFAPGCVVRGAASTIVNNVSQLGEFEVAPDGTIIFGIPGPALGPQAFNATAAPLVDINTITYNRLTCGCPVT